MSESTFQERRVNHDVCADHSSRLALLEQSSEGVQNTLAGVSTKLDLILAQITKVAILEERHATQKVDLDRAHDRIGEMEKDHKAGQVEIKLSVSKLSEETREFINQTKGFNSAVKMMLGFCGTTMFILLIKVLFFAASHGMPTP